MKTFWEKQAELKGRMEGIMEGKQEGKQEGKLEEKHEIAINLLSMGIDLEIIMKSTGLSKGEIEKLRSKLH